MLTIKKTKKYIYIDSDRYVDEKRFCTAQWLEWEWTVRLGKTEWDAWESAGAPGSDELIDHIESVLGEGEYPRSASASGNASTLLALLQTLEIGKRGIGPRTRKWKRSWLQRYSAKFPTEAEDIDIPEDTALDENPDLKCKYSVCLHFM